jgi:hypothetical protein
VPLLRNSKNNQPKWWRYQRVCAVFGDRDKVDVCHLDCAGGRHFHPTRAEAEEYVKDGAAEWLLAPVNRRDRGLIRMVKKAAALRGLSCKVGSYHAEAVRQRQDWAIAMLQDIRRLRGH